MPSNQSPRFFFQSKSQFSNKYLIFCSGYTPSEWNLPPFGFNDMPAAPANRGHYDGVGSHLKQISIPDKTPTFISAEYLQQVFKNPQLVHVVRFFIQEYSSEEVPVFWKLHNPCICECYAWCAKVLYLLQATNGPPKIIFSHFSSQIFSSRSGEKSPKMPRTPKVFLKDAKKPSRPRRLRVIAVIAGVLASKLVLRATSMGI